MTTDTGVDHSAQPDQVHSLRGLRAALLSDLEPLITLALQVAVLQAAGHRRAAIERQLGASRPDMDKAMRMVKRAAGRLEAGDARGPGRDF